jgi:hypothetical protein
MPMSYPMDATREAPISATIRDVLVAAWVSGSPDRPMWTIDVGGSEHSGPAVDVAKHDSPSAVKDMLREWAKTHPDLFV